MNEVLEYRLRAAARNTVWGTRDLLARPTVRWRGLPDYLIIGAQRCGTTTLQGLIASHPAVRSPWLRKGIHYFDTGYSRSAEWYRSQFPLSGRSDGDFVTGEASPYYLFHPLAPIRITDLMPDIKVIALLRDPVERAISHHKHEVRRGYEHLGLQEALAAEENRLAGEEDRLRTEVGYQSHSHQHHSYQSRGYYAHQLDRYAALLPDRNMLVLESETFWAEPKKVFTEVLDFLELPYWEGPSIPHLNATSPARADDESRAQLRSLFAPANEALMDRWGVGTSWS